MGHQNSKESWFNSEQLFINWPISSLISTTHTCASMSSTRIDLCPRPNFLADGLLIFSVMRESTMLGVTQNYFAQISHPYCYYYSAYLTMVLTVPRVANRQPWSLIWSQFQVTEIVSLSFSPSHVQEVREQ